MTSEELGPDKLPQTRMLSAEAFEALLLEVRDGANFSLLKMATETVVNRESHDAKIEDVRKVWHAAEVALGVLNLGRYVPKRESLEDVRAMLAWIDEA
jgi:hypothetical protein